LITKQHEDDITLLTSDLGTTILINILSLVPGPEKHDTSLSA